MKTERVALTAVGVTLALGALAVLVPSLSLGPLDPRGLVALLLWGTTGLFAGTALLWAVLTYVVGAGYESPAPVHGGEDVQVRILTVDAADVVQATVDSLPASLDDVHVVAETAMDVTGATVHVVPEAFDCEAVRKGRALPLERPTLADVYRMGVQVEQRAFARLSIPLFAWGGGIAVRRSVEDRITWNRETLVEDTAFVWAAARELDEFTFELSSATCRNEAPPSLTEITQQRRRWAAGNVRAAAALPPAYETLVRVRNYAWALSPVVTLVVVPLSVVGAGVAAGGLFLVTSLSLGLLTLFWYLRGVVYYGADRLRWALAVPLAPLVTVVHSMGTVAGILAPPEEFRVTKKVGRE